MVALAVGVSVAAASSAVAAGPPANDNFENAATISGTHGSGGRHDARRDRAARRTRQPGHSLPPIRSGTRTRPPVDGTLVVDTCENTAFFSTIAVFTGRDDRHAHARGVAPERSMRAGPHRVQRDSGHDVPDRDRRSLRRPRPVHAGMDVHARDRAAARDRLRSRPELLPPERVERLAPVLVDPGTIPAEYSCATLVSVPGVGLFGPRGFADSSGLVAGQPTARLRSGQAVRRSAPGAHDGDAARNRARRWSRPRPTAAAPRCVSTSTSVNNGTTNANVVLYRTGDCFRGDDVVVRDDGGRIGRVRAGAATRRHRPPLARRHLHPVAAAHIRPQPDRREVRGGRTSTRSAARSPPAPRWPNTCECGTPVDAAAALVVVAAGSGPRASDCIASADDVDR